MRKITNLAIAIGSGLCFGTTAQADDLRFVQAPVSTATVQKSAGTALPAFESSQTVVTYDQVQQNASRYQLLERKGTKEMYRDSRTGQKMTVRLENN
jgi:hypothetical protein